MSKNII